MLRWHRVAGLRAAAAGIVLLAPGCFLDHGLGPSGTSAVDAGPVEDAAPAPPALDAGRPEAPDAGMPEAIDAGPMCPPVFEPFPSSLADARLVWQGPGGAVGTGPALILTGDGHVRMWREAFDFPPDGEPAMPPDAQTTIPPDRLGTLFARLVTVDFSALPHDGGWAECYATLWFQVATGTAATMLNYDSAAQVSPDLECVWEWFDEALGPTYADYDPRHYCAFGL